MINTQVPCANNLSKWQSWDLNPGNLTLARPVHLHYTIENN